jgi:hypothetical protein
MARLMLRGMLALDVALPAGHLPHTGGDLPAATASPPIRRWRLAKAEIASIYPHVGEMGGRTEGRATERSPDDRRAVFP